MHQPLPKVDLVIPVLNEAAALEKSVRTVREFLGRSFPYRWQVTVADNGSTDGTFQIAERLSKEFADVQCFRLEQRGRGRALRHAWTRSDADIVAYTDVDLSTELEALEKLCRAIHEQGFDLGTGSRLSPQSQVTRGAKREFISRSYNLFVKCALFTHFSDAQCGFKAVSRRVVRDILPQVKDEAWFFDTELLTLAEKQGYRIFDQPVKWIDDDDSRVKIVSTAWEDIKGVMRVRGYLWSAEHREHLQKQRAAVG
ncbi:MAG: dolichyl-phosphate beta-glucosyltransferase [Planctomycetota bacterium]